MPVKKVKWGILGTSQISETLAHAIPFTANSELYAVASRKLETAKSFANKFSIATYYEGFDGLLNDKSIDAVYIGLPNYLHKEWTIKSALAGKHILCEKPLVSSEQDAIEIMHCVEQQKVFCSEALMYRYHPFTTKINEIISNKTIGDIKFYNATYTAHIADVANPTEGGSIRNLGCYPLSLIRLLADADPIKMTALQRMNHIHRNDSQASILLKFPSDAIAAISVADDIKMSWQFDIYATEGHLKIISNPWLPDFSNSFVINDHHGRSKRYTFKAKKPLYSYQIEALNKAILGVSNKLISLSDSISNAKMIEKWLST